MYLLPKYIILVRHGESMGNIDEEAYRYVCESMNATACLAI